MASYSFLNVKQPLATFKLLLVTFALVEFFFLFQVQERTIEYLSVDYQK